MVRLVSVCEQNLLFQAISNYTPKHHWINIKYKPMMISQPLPYPPEKSEKAILRFTNFSSTIDVVGAVVFFSYSVPILLK